MVNLREYLKNMWSYLSWQTNAAEIEIWSNSEVKREEITNYDEVQDYLAET